MVSPSATTPMMVAKMRPGSYRCDTLVRIDPYKSEVGRMNVADNCKVGSKDGQQHAESALDCLLGVV